jgi:hypothetical protein
MPKRNRHRKAAPAKAKRTKAGPKSTGKPKLKGAKTRPDPSASTDAEVRFVQPYEATKAYICPGCGREIPAGTHHLVAVPKSAPDLRRHWHRGCWDSR